MITQASLLLFLLEFLVFYDEVIDVSMEMWTLLCQGRFISPVLFLAPQPHLSNTCTFISFALSGDFFVSCVVSFLFHTFHTAYEIRDIP